MGGWGGRQSKVVCCDVFRGGVVVYSRGGRGGDVGGDALCV